MILRSLICRSLHRICTIPYSSWIVWNLILALIPLGLSGWLFRNPQKRRTKLWWVFFLTYAAFLPNAPYLLTDIIHTIEAARSPYPLWLIVLFFIPLHGLAIFIGFQAYVLSVLSQGRYLAHQGKAHWVGFSELLTHALCAIGIYLGRFDRLNSWDFVTDPTEVVQRLIISLTAKRPLLVIVITFVIITGFYWVMKQITLGLALRLQTAVPRNNSRADGERQ